MSGHITSFNCNPTVGTRYGHARGKSGAHSNGLLDKTGSKFGMGLFVMLLNVARVGNPLQAETAMLFQMITEARVVARIPIVTSNQLAEFSMPVHEW